MSLEIHEVPEGLPVFTESEVNESIKHACDMARMSKKGSTRYARTPKGDGATKVIHHSCFAQTIQLRCLEDKVLSVFGGLGREYIEAVEYKVYQQKITKIKFS